MWYALISANLLILLGVAIGEIRKEDLQYVGCFELSYSLSKNYHEHMPEISLQGCVDTCRYPPRVSSWRYIGIESSDNFCYCGGDIAEASVKRDDNLCNIICSDDNNRTCGGDWLMSLYDTHTNVPGSDRNDSVAFLIGLSTGIRVYNSTSLPEFETVMVTSNAWAYTVDYHYARRLVFTNTKGRMMMVGVSPSFGPVDTTPTLVKEQLSMCDGFAVDWVVDKIYWVDCTSRRPPRIMRVDLDGSNNELVISLDGDPRAIKRMELDPYKEMMIWMADGVIETLNLTNKVFRTNVSEPGIVVRALALDRSTQKVYYVGALDQISPLFSMDYSGSNHIKIFSVSQMQSVFGLGIHGGFIYWINYAMSTDIIYKAPLHLQGGREVKMLQTINKAVWHMRVIHPDIQKTPPANPCVHKGCSQFCMAVTSTSAVCQCSMGYELGSDGLSCESGLVSTIFSQRMPTTTTPSTTTFRVPRTIHYGNATYIGCYATSYAYQKHYNYKMHFVTLDKCINHCAAMTTPFAGIGIRDSNCFCGHDLATGSSKNADRFCNEVCPGQHVLGLTCGGDWLMSLYDISKMIPGDAHGNTTDSVNLLVGHSDSVRLYNSTDMDNNQQLMDTPPNEWAYGVDFHYNKNLMFMSSRKTLYRTRLFFRDEPSKPPVKLLKMGTCEGFAVDWVFDRIFWANCSEDRSTKTIDVVDLNGRNPASVGKVLGDGTIKRMEVDPYSGLLFWLRYEVIESCETSGQNFRTNLSSPDMSVKGIALDIQDKRLFYIGLRNEDGELFSVDYEGYDLKSYFHILEMRSVYGLGIVRGYVYWINYRSVDVLYKAPLDTSRGRMQQLKVFGSSNTVWHMKVVDRDLQNPPTTGPCVDGGFSCLAQKGQKTEKNTAGMVLLVVFMIVGGVVLAGLLVFLTNMRYWDYVRAKLPRVPYSRESGRDTEGPMTYDTNEDSVNLI